MFWDAPCALGAGDLGKGKEIESQMAKGGQPRASPLRLLLYPLPSPPTIQHGPTSASCLSSGFNPAGSRPQAQVPFLQPGTGGAGGSPVCQRGAGPGQTRPYTPSLTNTPEKSLGWGVLVQIIENFGEVVVSAPWGQMKCCSQ